MTHHHVGGVATASRGPAAPDGSRPLPSDPGEAFRRVGRLLRRLPLLVLVGVVRLYQVAVSPLTPPSCRYYPSCSQYALVALQRHGLLRGGWLAARRLARCHPWTPGGVDDVPPVRTTPASAHPGAADGDRSPVRTGPHLPDGPERARSSTR